MKKAISIVLSLCLISEMSVVFGAGNKYGEYRDYEVSNPKDINSSGPIYYPDIELMYDFDRAVLPSGVSVSGGNVSLSDKYRITLTEDRINDGCSLEWNTDGEKSKLTFETDGFKLDNDGFWGTGTLYNYSVAILRDYEVNDANVPEFSFILNTDCGVFKYPIKLYDEGWNFLNQQIERDKMKSGCKFSSIEIEQITGTACKVYIDNLLVATGAEIRGVEEPYKGQYITEKEIEDKYPTHTLTQNEIVSFRKIENKVLPDISLVAKLSDSAMDKYKNFYEDWHIETVGEKFANGLYPSYYHNTVPGTANSDGYGGTTSVLNKRATEFCSMFKRICQDYSSLKDEEQKAILESYIVGLGKLALTYGNVPEAWYSGRGFAEGCYYGREALEKAGILDDLYERLKKQYGLDRILYMEHVWGKQTAEEMNATADDFINNYSSNLIVLLMAQDSDEKARDFYRFKSYLDNVMYNFSPGTEGTFKADGTLFHHGANKYDYGWRDAFNNGIAKYPYYLDDTEFALSEESLERIELVSDVRFKTADVNGGVGTEDQITELDSSGLMYLSMIGGFKPKYASQWRYFGASQDEKLEQEYIKKGIIKPETPNVNVTLSYAATNVHRRGNWKLQTYGNNKLTYFNEYVRPGFLFYNLGGISITENGEIPAIRNEALSSVDGRHGFDLASGYNVNRAPGVTAPQVDAKLCEQPSHQAGSSDFVGGLSTKNGNGVFTNQFDLSDIENKEKYQKTGITDFKFKKSYFYFGDRVLCLGSDIGSNEELTTGVMQERSDEGESVGTSAGELSGDFNVSLSSNDVSWITDNKGKAGYYFFPNQNYTVKNGSQTFVYSDENRDYTGNYASAYINHTSEEVQNGTASYSYVICPQADETEMTKFAKNQVGEDVAVEIIRADSDAHIARDNEQGMTGYVIYNSDTKIQDCEVMEVTSPTVIMTKSVEEGKGMSIAVADPNLRINDKTFDYSQEVEINIKLKGKWKIKDNAEYLAREVSNAKTLLTNDGNTVFTLTCKDGLTNEYLLENVDEPLSDGTQTYILNTQQNSIRCIKGNKMINKRLNCDVLKNNNVEFISLSDIKNITGVSKIEYNDTTAKIFFDSKDITFTNNSNAVVINGEVEEVEGYVFEKNSEIYVPISVLSDVLGYDMSKIGDEIKFKFNDSVWKKWDKICN